MVQKETAAVRPEDHPKARSPDKAAVAPKMPEKSRNHPAKRVLTPVNKARALVPVVAWNQIWEPRAR